MDPVTEYGYQECARELTLAAIDAGALASDGADSVTTFYTQSAKALHEIDVEIGGFAMRTSMQLTVASIKSGAIYPSESLEFAQRIARGVRDVERTVDSRPRGIN